MKHSCTKMLLVLAVCCQTAVTLADDARFIEISENTGLLPLPYLNVLQQTNLLSENADNLFAWANTTEASTTDRTSFEESNEEVTGFDPILVVPGRSLFVDAQNRDALPPSDGFPEGNVLPLESWIAADGLYVGTTVAQPLSSTQTEETEETASTSLQLGVPLPIQLDGLVLEMNPTIPLFTENGTFHSVESVQEPTEQKLLPSQEPLPFLVENEVLDQPLTYLYTAPSMKYGNWPYNLDTPESPTLAERLEQWKVWTLNDYRTAFCYISQQFARIDWETLLVKIQAGDSDVQDDLDLEMMLWVAD
jgi:hypothetical protein